MSYAIHSYCQVGIRYVPFFARYIIILSHNKLVQGMRDEGRGEEYDQNVCGF